MCICIYAYTYVIYNVFVYTIYKVYIYIYIQVDDLAGAVRALGAGGPEASPREEAVQDKP